METDRVRRPAARRIQLLIPIVVLALAITGCGGTDKPHSAGDAKQSSAADSDRETAEMRLGQIGTRLGTVGRDYTAGKQDRAYTEAKAISEDLYEGTAEGVVAKDAPAVQRRLDALLATTLPTAIHNHSPVGQVAKLIGQAQGLARQGLAAIKKTE